jgi:(E)-4-hydroxy-3-methylbut-2-enyl-diphosphate synthase
MTSVDAIVMNPFPRRETRQIRIGDVSIGGRAPITVQSMTKTDTRDVRATSGQIRRLEAAGCEIVRLAVPDREAASALKAIKGKARIPIIADIHFDHRLALAAVEAGVDGLRINPGNIGSKVKVGEVVRAAAERGIPIRIGVNSGSLEKALLRKYGGVTAEAMVESALGHIRILEDLGFFAIKISLKASDIPRTLDAYRLLAARVDYPFHAGITEAGALLPGSVKSAAGLALLLNEGLADTIRVSLTAPPEREVEIARRILRDMKIRRGGIDVVSCPTCGRCGVDLRKIASRVERGLAPLRGRLTVAVMGCMVNGPGEAAGADVGVACGHGSGVIFRNGRVIRKVREADIVGAVIEEVRKMVVVRGE